MRCTWFRFLFQSCFVSAAMDELEQLQHLSLVSKVVTELENNVGIGDQALGTSILVMHCVELSCAFLRSRFVIHNDLVDS